MEHTVLGIVWQLGPCTTYAVMRELNASNSTYYQNRAGTAYPAVQRLLNAGLVNYANVEQGTRRERDLKITGEGLELLKMWLTPPVPEEEVSSSRDLLRLRMFFFGAVPAEQRKALVEASLGSLLEHLADCEALVASHSETDDPFPALAELGAVYETKARIEWLETVLSRLAGA